MNVKEYQTGMKLSLPIFFGYFAVSFGFGALAVTKGLKIIETLIISLTNVTSAGQFAGLTVITASAPILDMIVCQLVINSRYALMSLALSQKLNGKIGTFRRMLFAFHNTDEIFAVAMNRREELTFSFLMGLGILPVTGWVLGTLLGAVAGTLLPGILRNSLGAMLYGMFIAIVIPQTKNSKPIFSAVLIAAVLSSAFFWIPALKELSGGMATVIVTLLSAGICALLFPIPDENGSSDGKEERI